MPVGDRAGSNGWSGGSRSVDARWMLPWLAAATVIVTAPLILFEIRDLLAGPGIDWRNLSAAPQYANPYAHTGYVWSPLALPIVALATAPGLAVWTAAHFAVLAFLRDWRLIALVVLTFPFWTDLAVGNVLTFIAVTGYLAVNGNRWATGIFLVMAVLMPRPLMIPLTAWILWQRPEWRWPFAALLAVNVIGVLASGLADDWIRAIARQDHHMAAPWNRSPSAWIGAAWVPIGLALGAWLTWKGRIGLASLAVQPYLFQQYLLMLMLEWSAASRLDDPDEAGHRAGEPTRPRTHSAVAGVHSGSDRVGVARIRGSKTPS